MLTDMFPFQKMSVTSLLGPTYPIVAILLQLPLRIAGDEQDRVTGRHSDFSASQRLLHGNLQTAERAAMD